jgi:3-oxoacyl-[acyl-carrier protein] reductase
MELGLAGRTALVTASSKGLGRASAEALAAEGASLVVCGRGREALDEAAGSLRGSGADVLAVQADVARPEVAQQLVDAAIERFGRLDVVVANAGGPPPGHALDVDDDGARSAVEANLLASIRLVRAALPHLRSGGWGRICCITSYSVVQAIPSLALSNLARAGLRAWAKSAAYDLRGSGITLNLVCPGAHATDRMIELGAAADAVLGSPVDFGKVVAFLCSEPAAYLSGATVVVDGGETLAL